MKMIVRILIPSKNVGTVFDLMCNEFAPVCLNRKCLKIYQRGYIFDKTLTTCYTGFLLAMNIEKKNVPLLLN